MGSCDTENEQQKNPQGTKVRNTKDNVQTLSWNAWLSYFNQLRNWKTRRLQTEQYFWS